MGSTFGSTSQGGRAVPSIGALCIVFWAALIADPPAASADVYSGLVPRPRQVTRLGTTVRLDRPWRVEIRTGDAADAQSVAALIGEAEERGWDWRDPASPRRIVLETSALGDPDAYRLTLASEEILVQGASARARFHAPQTLRQIVRTSEHGALPAARVNDAPALRMRAVSLDVSRGRIPRIESLQNIIRRLGYYKATHLMLYMENSFDFSIPQTSALQKDRLTVSDIAVLQATADSHFVALVPIIQSLSHHENLLSHPDLNGLGERPWNVLSLQSMRARFADFSLRFGESDWGPADALRAGLVRCATWLSQRLWSTDENAQTTTFCVADPRAVHFVDGLVDDVVRAFSSEIVHVGGDEADETGKGRSGEAVVAANRTRLVGEYFSHRARHLRANGRRMMVYSDMIDPALGLAGWPQEAIIVVWNYHPGADFARADSMSALGFSDVVLSPGLWDWSAFHPNHEWAFESIRGAADAARQRGLLGIIASSWGDNGGESPLDGSWAGIVYAAATSWEATSETPEPFLARLAATLYGPGAEPIGHAEYLAGWQAANGGALNGRLYHRRPVIKPRSAEWIDQMRRLAGDMEQARVALERLDLERAYRDRHVAALRLAIDRYAFVARREIVLDGIARKLSGAQALEAGRGNCCPTSADVLAGLLQDARAIEASYVALWRDTARPDGLREIMARLERQSAEIEAMIGAAQRGELKIWRPGERDRKEGRER